jgi:hypothetical protein
MAERKTYMIFFYSRCMFVRPPCTIILLLILFFSFVSVSLKAQDDYNEISIYVEVPQIGGSEIGAVVKNNDLYLSVSDLFDFLKIRNSIDQDMETVSGFFINPEAPYRISRSDKKITYQGKIFELAPADLIRTESGLYMKSGLFGTAFGLNCAFDFRSLSARMTSKLELPMIREMRLEEMRQNLNKLKGEAKADTTIGRSYPLFKFGMADWSAIATEEINGQSYTRLNMALGAMVAGGEATANLYYNTLEPFSEKQQYYQWRYVNNDFSPLRQVMAGKISTNAISTIYNPVIGVQITNTPTTYRRSFGSYTLSDKTEPGWIVELYVNNVLVDYVKADASGFFTFQVPMVYGNSSVKLKFYGPWGEERVKEQNINIPFNFLPEKTLEYTASMGVAEDSSLSRFTKANVNYGLTRSITIGGGAEYLSSIPDKPLMPFVNTSVRVTNNLLVSGEYAYSVRTKGTLTYHLPSNMQLDVNYTWYDKDQKAINYNYRQERKAMFSAPVKFGKFATYQRLSVYQIILPKYKYTTGEWLFSGSIGGVNTNITTYALFSENTDANVYSTIALAFRLPAQLVIMPQTQVGFTKKEILSGRIALEKHIGDRAFVNMSVERYFEKKYTYAELGFRYDFSFAQVGASVRQANNRTSMVQYARGSLINDSKSGYFGLNNRTNVGRGGIAITAFVDVNGNGIRDKGEPKAAGLNLHATGGRIEKSDRDSTIRILGLEPYTICFVELDPNSFENISWKLEKKTLKVNVDPEIIKNIEIPISVYGEVTGYVLNENDKVVKGMGRIIIGIYNNDHKPAGKVLTEPDGYFSYFGLKPGLYTARIDTAQLRKIGLESHPDSLLFKIKPGLDGDIASSLEFRLKPVGSVKISESPYVRKDTTLMIVHEIVKELVTIDKDSYAIQMGAFKLRDYAEKMQNRIHQLTGKTVTIFSENGFFKVRIPDLDTRQDVDSILAQLQKNGIEEVWVISLKAKKIEVEVVKQDTVRQIKESKIQQHLTKEPNITIQLGAFRDKSNALALMKQLRSKYGDRLKIVFENGFYNLRLAGISPVKQTVLDELNKYNKGLAMIKFKDIWMKPPVAIEEEEIVQPSRTEVKIEKITVFPPLPELIRKEMPSILMRSRLRSPGFSPAVNISLRVGVFKKKSLAMKARRRIISKLHVNVDVVEKWNTYIVLIRGFHHREDTYKYYPELAGLGYPGVSLIEE